MVLRGALFFEVKERIICVKEGEVIAIPSNLPHAAFTKENPVIAIDAWSPVVVKYKSRNKHSCVMETERILASGFGMKA